MSARERFKQRFGKHLGRVKNPPPAPDGLQYIVEAFQPSPMEPVDWYQNRHEDVIDIIELKPEDQANGRVRELTKAGWQVTQIYKNCIQLVLKKEAKK